MVMGSSKHSQELYTKLTSLSLIIKLNIYCSFDHETNLFQLEYLEKPKIFPRLDNPLLRIETESLIIKNDEVVVYSDEVSLNYLVMKHGDPGNVATVIIGPFFYEVPTEMFVEEYMQRKNISLKEKHILMNYFTSVKVLDSQYINSIIRILSTLLANPFKNPGITHYQVKTVIPMDYLDYEELDDASNAIDLRYALQNELLHLVENGQTEEALDILSQIIIDVEGRAKTPLRSLKNLGLVLNTSLRIAAERGGVSPYQLHTKSNKFAIIIEDISNIQSIMQIQKDMVISYCKLVNRANTRGLSKPIMDAVHYIDNHLDRKISLLEISQHANINDSHLSRQFKKETGKTVTEYINEKKILRAKYYLENTNHSITEVSVMCGFENHNYFSKIFKEKTGYTPREYQKNIPPKEKTF